MILSASSLIHAQRIPKICNLIEQDETTFFFQVFHLKLLSKDHSTDRITKAVATNTYMHILLHSSHYRKYKQEPGQNNTNERNER